MIVRQTIGLIVSKNHVSMRENSERICNCWKGLRRYTSVPREPFLFSRSYKYFFDGGTSDYQSLTTNLSSALPLQRKKF